MTDDDLAQSWRRIRAELRTAVSDATWQLYLEALDARRLDGGTLVVTAPDESRAWITERFSRLLQAAAGRVLGVRDRGAARRRPTTRAPDVRHARARATVWRPPTSPSTRASRSTSS